MDLYDALESLEDKKFNHKMIVHGINGERVVVPLNLIQFVSSIAVDRNDIKFARSSCKFAIKEIILNRYNKKLSDDQYSALLTLLIHCRSYDGDYVKPEIAVKYVSSKEKKYSDDFKELLRQNLELEEAIYNIGFDTGDISLMAMNNSVTEDIMAYLTTRYVNTLPEEIFVPDGTYPDAETISFLD